MALLTCSSCLLTPGAAPAVELRGSTYFQTPPWKLSFRTFYSTVFERGGEYYVTVTLPEQAGAGLGGLDIQQTGGADWTFPYMVSLTRAFLGQPRREGPAVPVEVEFEEDTRRFRIRFPEPPAPGQTVTVALRPVHNPGTPGIYLFSVVAWPAGPDPVSNPVGVGRLSIYSPSDFGF
jgi:hypothetical protein